MRTALCTRNYALRALRSSVGVLIPFHTIVTPHPSHRLLRLPSATQSKVKAAAVLRATADAEQARLHAVLAAAADEFDSAAEGLGSELQRSISAAVAAIKHAHAEVTDSDRAIMEACTVYLKALEAAAAALDDGTTARCWVKDMDDAGASMIATAVAGGEKSLIAAHEARQSEGARVYRHLAGLVQQVAALQDSEHGGGKGTTAAAEVEEAVGLGGGMTDV